MTQQRKSAVVRAVAYGVAGLALAGVLFAISAGRFVWTGAGWGGPWHLGTAWISTSSVSDRGKFSVGVNTDVHEQDLGLPIYPSARPHKDDDSDHDAANVWAQAGTAGLKVAAKEFETDDPPEKVIAFYRPLLAKYGSVLTCTGEDQDDAQSDDDAQGKLTCHEDTDREGLIELKAGRPRDQHIASFRPLSTGGTVFALVALRIGGME